MKNPTYPDNIVEIPNIFFNQLKDLTLNHSPLIQDNTSKAQKEHGGLSGNFNYILKDCGVDYVRI